MERRVASCALRTWVFVALSALFAATAWADGASADVPGVPAPNGGDGGADDADDADDAGDAGDAGEGPGAEGDAPAGAGAEGGDAAAAGDDAPPRARINPAPDVRKRPPPPPPPGAAMPDWDVDHLSRDVLPPALPKPLPFDLRNIRFRHDLRNVSADGRIAPVRRVPQWVDVIEREEITEWRPKNLGFFAQRYPNVIVGDLGNPFLQVPGIRGLSGDRVKILTDGVWPGTQALGSQGGTLSLWDPESTERVEIYHGPGAYLRAIDSPGGFINIVPRRPRQHGPFSYDVRGSLSLDSAQRRYRGRAEIDVGQERVAALGGVTWTSTGDRVTGNGGLGASSFDQLAADLAMDYFLGPNARLGITLQYNEATNIESPASTGTASQPNYDRLFLGFTLSAFSPGEVYNGARISFALDSVVQKDDLTIASEEAGIGNADDVLRYDFSFAGPLYLFCCHQTWAEISVSYGFLERTETLLCIDEEVGNGELPQGQVFEALKIDDPRRPHADLSNCDPIERTFEAEELFISGLITDTIHNGCYDVYTGVRADYYHVEDAQFGEANRDDILISAAAGTALHLTRRTSVYGNLSYGSRRPTLFELGAIEIVNGDTIFGNPELDAEIHGNAEVGVKTSFKNIWSLQGAVFAHYIDDTIAPAPLGGGGGGLLENQGSVWLYGAEVTGAWRPLRTFEGLELWGSLGITESTDRSLASRFPLKYQAAARYSVPSPKGYVVRRWFSEMILHGALDSRVGNTGGSAYTTADFVLGGQVDLGKGHWAELNLGVTNLFNTSYVPAGAVFRSPGLSFFASFSFDV